MMHDELRFAHRFEMMQDLSTETVTFRNNLKMRALPMRQYGSFLLGNNVGVPERIGTDKPSVSCHTILKYIQKPWNGTESPKYRKK